MVEFNLIMKGNALKEVYSNFTYFSNLVGCHQILINYEQVFVHFDHNWSQI